MRCAAVCRGQGPGAVLAVSDAPSWRSPVHRLVAGAVVMSATGVALEPISGAPARIGWSAGTNRRKLSARNPHRVRCLALDSCELPKTGVGGRVHAIEAPQRLA